MIGQGHILDGKAIKENKRKGGEKSILAFVIDSFVFANGSPVFSNIVLEKSRFT